MSPVYSRSLPLRRLVVRQDEGGDELFTESSQTGDSSTSTFPESSSVFVDDLTSSFSTASIDSTVLPDFTSTSLGKSESESESSSATSTESSSGSSETESASSDSESSSSSDSESLSTEDSQTLTSSPTSSIIPTSTSFTTSTPLVTVTVDEETSSSSATSSSSESSSSESASSSSTRSVRIKVEGASSTVSPPETTLVITTSNNVGDSIQATDTNVVDPSSTGGVSSAAADAENDNGFWENKSAVGGTFAVVGITILVVIFLVIRIMLRRRRARAEMLDEKFVPFPTAPSTHYRDESFGTPYARQPSPTELLGNPLNAYNHDVYYDTAAYYDAESSDHSHSHEGSFSAYPGLAQAATNVYLPPMVPSPATAPSTGGRPSTAQSQNQSQHQNPFSDPAPSTTSLDRSPFADPVVPQVGNHLRPQAPVASHSAGRISSLYTASEVDSFYGDEAGRAV